MPHHKNCSVGEICIAVSISVHLVRLTLGGVATLIAMHLQPIVVSLIELVLSTMFVVFVPLKAFLMK